MVDDNGRAHILIVDDDPVLVGTISTFMTKEGFEVSAALDGEEGFQKAADERPDLVILDIMMPGKDGIEVMRELQMDPRTKDIPILFLTSIDDEAVIVKGLKGAEDYMVKPFMTLELEARVNKILERCVRNGDNPDGLSGPDRDRLAIRLGDETYLLPLKQVFFFEALGKYTYAYTKNRRILTDCSIGDLEKKLSSSGFIRLHRSYIVKINGINKVLRKPREAVVVVMGDEAHTELHVSESYLPAFKTRLGL